MLTVPKVTIGGPPKPIVERVTPKEIELFGKTLTTEQASDLFFQLDAELDAVDPRYIRAIIIGPKGTGKTRSCLYTLPRPILLLAFDPDSERMIKPEWRANGEVTARRYYGDNPKKPEAYLRYEREVEQFKDTGYFNSFASVVVDGFSTMQQAHLNQIAFEDQQRKDEMRKNDPSVKVRRTLMPELQDYSKLKTSSILGFMSLCAIPCHLILTAHIKEEPDVSDEGLVRIRTLLNATPALTANVPPLFGEVYLAEENINNNPKKDEPRKTYTWLTERTNKQKELPLVTRFNVDGDIVAQHEPQDFRALLKKVGYLYKDKPFIKRNPSA